LESVFAWNVPDEKARSSRMSGNAVQRGAASATNAHARQSMSLFSGILD